MRLRSSETGKADSDERDITPPLTCLTERICAGADLAAKWKVPQNRLYGCSIPPRVKI